MFLLFLRHVNVHPKGNCCRDHLSLFLHVASPKSLRPGWKRRASFCFVFLNQSGKEVHRKAGNDLGNSNYYYTSYLFNK